MPFKSHKAFTIVEFIFVIVIVGILSMMMIPKFTSTVTRAYMAKGKNTLTIVRNAIAIERQKRILREDFTNIKSLNGSGGVFTTFDDSKGSKVLEYDIESCKNIGCWSTDDGVVYTFYRKDNNCIFKLENNRFNDKTIPSKCIELY